MVGATIRPILAEQLCDSDVVLTVRAPRGEALFDAISIAIRDVPSVRLEFPSHLEGRGPPNIMKDVKGGLITSLETRKLTRREFTKDVGIVAGAAVVSQGLIARVWAQDAQVETYAPEALSAQELRTLKAVMARLIPADEAGGGAAEAQTYVYVDRSLGHSYATSLPAYQQGLAGLDGQAEALGAASFEELSDQDQDALLTKLEKGDLDAVMSGGQVFFNMVRGHTLEGMFGDPMYGGNKDFIGWDLIGYYGMQLIYSEDQQAVGTHVKPAHQSAADLGGEPVL